MFTNMLTMGQVIPCIPSQLCMHRGTCANSRNGARAHKAILHKIVYVLGKIKQAMHNVLRGVYVPYCRGSRLILPSAARTRLGAMAILAKL